MKQINKYILTIIGLIMFMTLLWYKFIRERIPKDIPFTLSVLSFIILLYICVIYLYIIYNLIFEKKHSNVLIKALLTYMYKPLKTLDESIKNSIYINKYYKHFIVYLVNKLSFILNNSYIYYYIFWIFPRIVLVFTLCIDTFYFHKLFYIYKILLIGILLFLNRYIIYSFKHTKELLIVEEEPYISSFTVEYVPGVVPYDEDEDDNVDEEDKGWIPPTMQLPLRKFIEYQTSAIVYQNKKYSLIIWTTDKYWEELRKKYKLDPKDRVPRVIINKVGEERNIRIENIIQLSVILEYYHIINITNEKYKNLKKLIFANYLLCWVYILIMSVHTLSSDSIILLSNITSGIIMIGIMGLSYLYSCLIIKLAIQQKENNKKKENNSNEKIR